MTADESDAFAEFRTTGSDAAFRAIVTQHLPMVWSAARRVTNGDAALAQDVAQTVFTDFARKGRSLSASTVVAAWLHRHTFFTASKAVRSEIRRREREQHAAALNPTTAMPPSDDSMHDLWTEVAPHLDGALDSLSREDRELIAMRFFEKRNYRDIALQVDATDDAVRKRVTRALEKLRQKLGRYSPEAKKAALPALAAAISAKAIEPLPGSLAPAVTAAGLAALAGAGVGGLAAGGAGLSGLIVAAMRILAHKTALKIAGVVVVLGIVALVWKSGIFSVADGSTPAKAVGVTVPPSGLATTDSGAAIGGPVTAEITIFDGRGTELEALLLGYEAFTDDAQIFATLSSMAANTAGKKVFTLDLPRGGRGKIERVKERRYPTAFDYDSKTGEPTAKEFETRNLGTSIDLHIEGPQPTGQFSVEIDGRIVTEAKEPLKYPLSLLPDTPEPHVEQPDFRLVQVKTAVSAPPEEPTLVSWHHVPSWIDEGGSMEPRYVLFFLTLHLDSSFSGRKLTAKTSSTSVEPSLFVRTTTFAVPTQMALEAWHSPGNDEALYQKLAGLAGGGVEVLMNSAVRTRSAQRSKVAAISEHIYPAELGLIGALSAMGPDAFETRNVGEMVELEPAVPTIPEASHRTTISLGFEGRSVRLEGMQPVSSWENSWEQAGGVRMPLYVEDFTGSKVSCTPGAEILVSCVPDVVGRLAAEGSAASTAVSFVRLWMDSDAADEAIDPAENESVQTLRIEVPIDAAVQTLLDREASADGDWVAKLAATGGETNMRLTSLIRKRVDGGDDAKPDEQMDAPGVSDEVRFTVDTRARVESAREIIYATARDNENMRPTAFETQNTGEQLRFERGFQENDVIEFESSCRIMERSIGMGNDANDASTVVTQPYYFTRDCSSAIPLLPDRVRLLAATAVPSEFVDPTGGGSPGGAEGERVELEFVRYLGGSAKDRPAGVSLAENQMLELSVSPDVASGAKAALDGGALAHEFTGDLLEKFSGGEVWIVSLAVAPSKAGKSVRCNASGQIIHDANGDWPAFKSRPTFIFPFALQIRDDGLHGEFQWSPNLSAGPPNGTPSGAVDVELNFSLSAAPARHPKAAEWLRAKPGSPERRTQFFINEIKWKSPAPIPMDSWQIVDVSPSKAPAGHRDHGRWHVVLYRLKSLK